MTSENEVGPVFSASPRTASFLAAIRRGNPAVRVIDRGSYVRVLAVARCVLQRSALEEELGTRVAWPEGLEAMMPSFKGRLVLTAEGAEWTCHKGIE